MIDLVEPDLPTIQSPFCNPHRQRSHDRTLEGHVKILHFFKVSVDGLGGVHTSITFWPAVRILVLTTSKIRRPGISRIPKLLMTSSVSCRRTSSFTRSG